MAEFDNIKGLQSSYVNSTGYGNAESSWRRFREVEGVNIDPLQLREFDARLLLVSSVGDDDGSAISEVIGDFWEIYRVLMDSVCVDSETGDVEWL